MSKKREKTFDEVFEEVRVNTNPQNEIDFKEFCYWGIKRAAEANSNVSIRVGSEACEVRHEDGRVILGTPTEKKVKLRLSVYIDEQENNEGEQQ